MPKLQSVFAAAGISVDHTIDKTAQGNIYLSSLKRKLPEALQYKLTDCGTRTWRDLFDALQRYRNQKLEDVAIMETF